MLGEGAIALHRAAYALDAVRRRLAAYGERFFESEERSRPYEDLRRLTQEMDALTDDFSAALGGDHEAVEAFTGARASMQGIVETLEALRDPATRGAAGAPLSPEDAVAEIEEQWTSFDASRDRFMEAVRQSAQKEQG